MNLATLSKYEYLKLTKASVKKSISKSYYMYLLSSEAFNDSTLSTNTIMFYFFSRNQLTEIL